VPLTCNQSCEALLPKEGINSEYLYYLLVFIRPILERFGAGTTFPSVTRRDIRDVRVSFPMPSEQKIIADVLVKIDDHIAVAEEKLTAARRVKTALMQQLFTRGIPGRHTRFQQTKVGEIPEDWELKTLSAHCGGPDCVRTGPFGAQLPPEAFAKIGIRMVNITDIGEGELDLTSDFYVRAEVFDRLKDYSLVEGDVVFSRVASVGRLGLIHKEHEPLLMSSNCIRLRPRGAFNSKFLTHVFLDAESVARQVEAMSNAGARPIVTPRFLRRMLIPRPPRDEQDEIASLIEAADANVRGVRSEITSLERVKRSLLQNLLTGRVRVRVES
jgi:type I restriction enzyme S subunit